jgi:CelD/BcsL family acetyltransferase involved in cellulose biosynthesis
MDTAASPLRIELLDSWETAESLRPGWNQLLEQSSSCTIFLTWEWLTAWWSVHSSSRNLLLLAGLDSDGRALALAPLFRWRGRILPGMSLQLLRLVGDGTHDSDNLDCIAARGCESAAARGWLEWLEGHRQDWDVLELSPVPKESPLAAALLEQLRQRSWTFLVDDSPRALLALPADWESYLRALSKNMKTAIETKSRRLERRYQVEFHKCAAESELPGALDDLYRLHENRWESRTGKGAFRAEARRRFYQAMTRALLRQGWLELWSLSLNGKIVATELGFRYGDAHYFLQGGFDTEYSADSVGLVLKARIIREAIQDGLRWYDFLGGGEDYKTRWGAEIRSYLRLRCAAPRSLGALYLRALDRGHRGKERLRGAIPHSVWEALRRSYRRLRPYHPGPVEKRESE